MSLAQRSGLAACRVTAGGAILKSTGIISVTRFGVGQCDLFTQERYDPSSVPMVGTLLQDKVIFAFPDFSDDRHWFITIEDGPLGFIFDDAPWWFIIERIVT